MLRQKCHGTVHYYFPILFYMFHHIFASLHNLKWCDKCIFKINFMWS